MAADADKALGSQLLRRAPRMVTPPRHEVDFIVAVTLGGIKAIADAWEPHLAPLGLRLNIQGVFCHGSPQVTHGAPPCELADLLVVVDRRQDRKLLRRAVLIQVKMARAACRVTLNGLSSVRQLFLYQRWPDFTFVDRTRFGSATYRLAGSPHGEAGTFGVIDRHLRDPNSEPPIWTQHQPTPTPSTVTSEPKLGTFITKMLAGQAAYGRFAPQNPKDDWTAVVELLLKFGYSQPITHRRTLGDLRPPRGYSAYLLMPGSLVPLFVAAGIAAIPPETPPIEQLADPREPSGISSLHIEVEGPPA